MRRVTKNESETNSSCSVITKHNKRNLRSIKRIIEIKIKWTRVETSTVAKTTKSHKVQEIAKTPSSPMLQLTAIERSIQRRLAIMQWKLASLKTQSRSTPRSLTRREKVSDWPSATVSWTNSSVID